MKTKTLLAGDEFTVKTEGWISRYNPNQGKTYTEEAKLHLTYRMVERMPIHPLDGAIGPVLISAEVDW